MVTTEPVVEFPLTVAEAAGVSIWERLDPELHQQLMNYLDNNEE